MKHILCYGDSNTYGLSPEWIHGAPGRHDINTRWTGLLQKKLGSEYRIIEEGLNGRTTVFQDPTDPGRCGLDFIKVAVDTHLPLDLVIIMLGTNDCKKIFNASPMEIANGIGLLAKTVLNPYNYSLFPAPKVLIVAPAPLGEISASFEGGMFDASSLDKSRKLAGAYKPVADMLGCEFLDLAPYAETAPFEGIHLTAEAHSKVADTMEKKIREILG